MDMMQGLIIAFTHEISKVLLNFSQSGAQIMFP